VDLEQFQKKKLTPIRLRVFNLLKLWLEEHYRDFDRDQNAQELLQKFINEIIAKDMPSAAPQLLRILRSGIEGTPTADQLQFDSKPPRPYLPMNLKGQLTVLDLHPEEVARQLTLIDQNLYRQIRPREFLGSGWSKSDKEVRSPGIIAMINNFNKVRIREMYRSFLVF
jgi:son of sevenless-like protein